MSPASRSRRGTKGRAERQTRSRPPRVRSAWGWGRTAAALAAAVGAAILVWTLLREAREVEPPPFSWETGDDGVRVGRVAPEALAEWCRRHELPSPPSVSTIEAVVAEHVSDALTAAATRADAGTLGKLGQIWESLEAHDSAYACFERAADLAPEDFRWPYYLGCIDQVAGRNEAAVEWLEQARSLDPGYVVTWARLGQLNLDLGREEEAASMFQRYHELRQEDWFGLVGLAKVALRRQEPERALELLQEAVRAGKHDFQVQHTLGETYRALGERELARRHFARAAELPQGAWFFFRDPLDQELHASARSVKSLEAEFQLASVSGDWPLLASLAEEIVRRRSGDVTMLGNLAGLYRKMGRYDEAHHVLDRALELGPDRIRLLTLRAEVLLAENRFEETLVAADEVLGLAPDEARAHALCGRALLMLGRHSEAETALRRAVELAPTSGPDLFVLGEALRVQERVEEARIAYGRALEAEPGYEPALQRLAEFPAP